MIQPTLLCHQYLNILYQGAKQSLPRTRRNLAETYGEILLPAVDKILKNISLTDDDVFLDLGSGMGKVTLQVFLRTMVKAAYGIEISADLHHYATQAAERVQQELPEFFHPHRKLTFSLGSFLEIPFHDATVALINSICFPPDVLDPLGSIIDETLSIHTVLTLRPIPTLNRLTFQKTIQIECSWGSSLCYMYR